MHHHAALCRSTRRFAYAAKEAGSSAARWRSARDPSQRPLAVSASLEDDPSARSYSEDDEHLLERAQHRTRRYHRLLQVLLIHPPRVLSGRGGRPAVSVHRCWLYRGTNTLLLHRKDAIPWRVLQSASLQSSVDVASVDSREADQTEWPCVRLVYGVEKSTLTPTASPPSRRERR